LFSISRKCGFLEKSSSRFALILFCNYFIPDLSLFSINPSHLKRRNTRVYGLVLDPLVVEDQMIRFIFLILSFCLKAGAAHEVAFDEVWKLSDSHSSKKDLDLSLYISKRSDWKKSEIKSRLLIANDILNTCEVQIARVYVHSWLPSNPLLRLDEYISENQYYDGLRHASYKSRKVTDLQLFYFEDYQEGMTSGPALPLAVYPSKRIEPVTFNTAWFPYLSAQRLRTQGLKYNEEAHEIGHILLQTGHTQHDPENILANDSKKRRPLFLPNQCETLRQHPSLKESLKDKVYSIFASYFHTYSRDFYMTDWCSRNTQNLSQGLHSLFAKEDLNAKQVFLMHEEEGRSLSPNQARKFVSGWRFHSFLLLDDRWVLDLDFGKRAKIVPFKEYLASMFAGEFRDLKYILVDPAENMPITYNEVVALFSTMSSENIYQTGDLFPQ
jgi:hypothetical protein